MDESGDRAESFRILHEHAKAAYQDIENARASFTLGMHRMLMSLPIVLGAITLTANPLVVDVPDVHKRIARLGFSIVIALFVLAYIEAIKAITPANSSAVRAQKAQEILKDDNWSNMLSPALVHRDLALKYIQAANDNTATLNSRKKESDRCRNFAIGSLFCYLATVLYLAAIARLVT